MKYLLDTHLLLWAATQPRLLPRAARALMSDTSNDLYFSAASLWEIAIKASLRRDRFAVNARALRRALVDNSYQELPITGNHALYVETLPLIHRDPFDRILIAQATVEGLTLLTVDSALADYPGPIRKLARR